MRADVRVCVLQSLNKTLPLAINFRKGENSMKYPAWSGMPGVLRECREKDADTEPQTANGGKSHAAVVIETTSRQHTRTVSRPLWRSAQVLINCIRFWAWWRTYWFQGKMNLYCEFQSILTIFEWNVEFENFNLL